MTLITELGEADRQLEGLEVRGSSLCVNRAMARLGYD